MPYIITTTYPPEHDGATGWMTHRAVATLYDAKRIMRAAIQDAEWPADIGGHNARRSARGQVDDLMASGGHGVRLPDGARIEVEAVGLNELHQHAFGTDLDTATLADYRERYTAEIIAAFNDVQGPQR